MALTFSFTHDGCGKTLLFISYGIQVFNVFVHSIHFFIGYEDSDILHLHGPLYFWFLFLTLCG